MGVIVMLGSDLTILTVLIVFLHDSVIQFLDFNEIF